MPVGTQATVKTLAADDLEALRAPIILGNTYHLMLRPGMEVMEQLGGLHAFQDWHGPILTDSGGFQVFSLSSLRKITEEGVSFQSHIDGRRLFMGPKESMAVQRVLGSDIAMLFDECIPYPATPDYAAKSVEKTLRWARVCLEQPRAEGQLYFGIVQGSEYAHLRKHCALELAAMEQDGLDGFAVGGVSVGEPEPFILKGIGDSVPFMPRHRPRYVMGLGDLWQMTEAVGMGCDMFDCVIPTRNALHQRWPLPRQGRCLESLQPPRRARLHLPLLRALHPRLRPPSPQHLRDARLPPPHPPQHPLLPPLYGAYAPSHRQRLLPRLPRRSLRPPSRTPHPRRSPLRPSPPPLRGGRSTPVGAPFGHTG